MYDYVINNKPSFSFHEPWSHPPEDDRSRNLRSQSSGAVTDSNLTQPPLPSRGESRTTRFYKSKFARQHALE